MLVEAGAFYMMDRGYLDFARLYAMHRARGFFVTRAIQVGGHDIAIVHAMACTVLMVVAFTELDDNNLGNDIGFIGGF
jgi:hypothetical protein